MLGYGITVFEGSGGGGFDYRLLHISLKENVMVIGYHKHSSQILSSYGSSSVFSRPCIETRQCDELRIVDGGIGITCNNNDIITDKVFNVHYVKKISISKSLHSLYKLEQKYEQYYL